MLLIYAKMSIFHCKLKSNICVRKWDSAKDRCIFWKEIFQEEIKDLYSFLNHVECVSIGINAQHVRDHTTHWNITEQQQRLDKSHVSTSWIPLFSDTFMQSDSPITVRDRKVIVVVFTFLSHSSYLTKFSSFLWEKHFHHHYISAEGTWGGASVLHQYWFSCWCLNLFPLLKTNMNTFSIFVFSVSVSPTLISIYMSHLGKSS